MPMFIDSGQQCQWSVVNGQLLINQKEEEADDPRNRLPLSQLDSPVDRGGK